MEVIEGLTKVHGLDSMDFESQKTQELIESIGELIRFKEVSEKIVDVSLRNESEEEEVHRTDTSFMKMKVTKLKKELGQGKLSQGVGIRTTSA